MVASRLKQTVGMLVVLSCLGSSAHAWQFRDLDMPSPPRLEATAPQVIEDLGGVLDLVPTEQKFSQPASQPAIVEAPLVQPEAKPRPLPVQLQPTPQPTVAVPKPVARPIPQPEPETLQPTPAAETLTEVPAAKPTDAFADARTTADLSGGEVYAAKFNNVQAGTTTASELIDLWGAPAKTVKHADGSATKTYKIPSFEQVDVTVEDKLVTSVLVHLTNPLSASVVEQELGLTGFDPVPIPDEYGDVLGQSYPERGLMFSFLDNPKTNPDTQLVTAIISEPISAEMFRLRAQYDFEHNYARCLQDLESAIEIDPKDGESYWLSAELQDATGATRAAMKSAQKAVRMKPTNPLYRLTRARLYAKTNRLQTAIEEVKSIIHELDMPKEIAGRAHLLLGDLKAIGPDADHQVALRHHLKAIDAAMKPVDDRRFSVRRMAKHVLVSAHMSVARDIAMGNFQRQTEVVPKWLLRATEMADEFISDDHGDELLQMHIYRDTLASYGELQVGSFDAAVATEEALSKGREIIAKAKDDSYKMHVERVLAETLLHAAKIARSRAKYDTAMKHANNALALLQDTDAQWEEMGHDKYLEGQLYFVMGSISAIRDADHDEAVRWYSKARTTFVASNFVSPLYSARGHGEMYVSMGLSFWENGERDKAVQLTQTGAELMKDAVETGSLQLKAMAVPYGNLATMHGKLGQADKSQEYAKLVAKVEQIGAKRR